MRHGPPVGYSVSTDALRMRANRARLKIGRRRLWVEVDAWGMADYLCEVGLLAAWDSECPKALAAAIEKLLEHILRSPNGSGGFNVR
jgi:hypothetical protein